MVKTMEKKHVIREVEKDSIAERLGIEAGDVLISINDQIIDDIFDYQFLLTEEHITLVIHKPAGEKLNLTVDKEADEDLGLVFDEGLMDDYHSCCNKCIFCFIDQMPPGMRETLYFKDDDMRLSFLQGNYVTLTNMSDHDIDRIIKYHLSPINISFQTTNPKLRCEMLHNRFAGEALSKAHRLYEAGIEMNGQIVLCKGVNDGEELERSIEELLFYAPVLESVSVVPVGITKYRDGLYPLEPFTKEDAVSVLNTIHKWQKAAIQKCGLHFVHASDEWYLLAEQELPKSDNYDGYLQLENGVGMLRLLMEEFDEAFHLLKKSLKKMNPIKKHFVMKQEHHISMATGKLAYPVIKELAGHIEELFPKLHIEVYCIRNGFFGEKITVAGLLTGQDIIHQLKDKKLGERLILPDCLLRFGEEVLLDDVTLSELENALQVKIDIVKSSGQDFVDIIVGEYIYG